APGTVCAGSLEGAVAIPEQNRYPEPDHGDVHSAIVVEIAERYVGAGAYRNTSRARGLEGPIAVAQENQQVAAAEIANHQVRLAIAIHISHRYGLHAKRGGIVDSRPEAAISVAQQYGDVIAQTGICHDEIEHSVAVEVRQRRRPWKLSG